jgi:hypothetical protein
VAGVEGGEGELKRSEIAVRRGEEKRERSMAKVSRQRRRS